MSTPSEVLDSIIKNLIPENIPPEYITMAKIIDFHGVEHIYRGEEMLHVLKYPELYNIAEARIVLNVRKIKNAIIGEVNHIYDEVNRRYVKRSLSLSKKLPPPDND